MVKTSDFESILNPAEEPQPPRYIVIEGPIGAGKTTLTKMIAKSLGYETMLEKAEENPFLPRFYSDRHNAALPTQLFFLLQRVQQISTLRQEDLFAPNRVADFLIEKDQLFAEVNLGQDELKLYQQIYQHLTIDAEKPDLVVYLQAPANVLLERIKKRGIPEEQSIDEDYLNALIYAYTKLFHYYDSAPLLIINAANIDWANSEADYKHLLEYLLNIKSGRHYYNPQPSL